MESLDVGRRAGAEIVAQSLPAVGERSQSRSGVARLDVQPHQEQFLRSLANSNGGTYTRIDKQK